MFLTKNNEMLWQRLGWGAVVTAAIVLFGMFFIDAPLYMITRGVGDWGIWVFFGRVFDAKVWIVVSAIVFALSFFMKKLKVPNKWQIVLLNIFN